MRYIDRNPGKVKDSAQSLIGLLGFVFIAFLIGLYAYGIYALLIVLNLSLTLGVFWLIYNSIFNSQDAKERPEAYDHVAGMGFAITYGLAFIVIFVFVLVQSMSYVHGVVYG